MTKTCGVSKTRQPTADIKSRRCGLTPPNNRHAAFAVHSKVQSLEDRSAAVVAKARVQRADRSEVVIAALKLEADLVLPRLLYQHRQLHLRQHVPLGLPRRQALLLALPEKLLLLVEVATTLVQPTAACVAESIDPTLSAATLTQLK